MKFENLAIFPTVFALAWVVLYQFPNTTMNRLCEDNILSGEGCTMYSNAEHHHYYIGTSAALLLSLLVFAYVLCGDIKGCKDESETNALYADVTKADPTDLDIPVFG